MQYPFRVLAISPVGECTESESLRSAVQAELRTVQALRRGALVVDIYYRGHHLVRITQADLATVEPGRPETFLLDTRIMPALRALGPDITPVSGGRRQREVRGILERARRAGWSARRLFNELIPYMRGAARPLEVLATTPPRAERQGELLVLLEQYVTGATPVLDTYHAIRPYLK